MDNKAVFDDSVIALKKTIPLMMKYSVPVLPKNYALWYTYVSNENPELSKEIDSVLSTKAPFTDLHADNLFDKHFQSTEHEQVEQLSNSVEEFAYSISQSIGFTQQGAEKFEQAMDICHGQLNDLENSALEAEEISKFVGDLLSKSLEMRDNAKGFGESLKNAQDEIKQLREKLESSREEALRDELTGALNRRAFNTKLDKLIATKQSGSALIICDIDHFKQFNDTHGHLLGDQVLKAVAGRLSQYSAVQATTYRFGGEEFAVLVHEGGIGVAMQLAESLRRKIERLSIKDKKSQQQIAKITCSFGVAEYDESLNNFTWIELADERLYQAKETGRNKVVSN